VSYAAEPYARFVNDLLTAFTGGVIREPFVFVIDDGQFRLSPPGPLIKSTLQVSGQADRQYREFLIDRDFELTPDLDIRWKRRADGTPAAGAVWPDEGTSFYASYDFAGASPMLSDRNPGSVTRMLAESVAREYAVLSRQLESVYQAGFLDTAGGRDLDQLVALVGVTRHDRTFAVGSVVFARSTPALADIFIPAGTRLSTAEPPAVVFATTEDRTLHRGSLSVEVPVAATVSGQIGVVPARAIAVVHRPIFGIETVSNAQTTALSGDTESDEALRMRARRALESAGKATAGALLGALATLPGVREKDLRIAEDHLSRPGVLTLNVAVPLDSANCLRAVDLIEQTRPAGIRVLHNLDCGGPLTAPTPSSNVLDEEETPADAVVGGAGLFAPVVATAVLLPAAQSMTPQDRSALKRKAEDAIRAFVGDAGIGETLVYNRLVANLMSLDGVLDVRLELYPAGTPLTLTRQNVAPGSTLRPTVDEKHGGAVEVEIGGQLVALDVTVSVTLVGAGTIGDRATNLEDARVQIAGQLAEAVGTVTALSVPSLLAKIVATRNFTVDGLTFTIEYLDAGVRINKVFVAADPPMPVDSLQRLWIRSVKIAESA